jgi:hypothetical protein
MQLRSCVQHTVSLFLLSTTCLRAQKPHPELDIHYGRESNQTLDLYLPAKKAFTTVAYTYGGGGIREAARARHRSPRSWCISDTAPGTAQAPI